ncbi:MAG: carboxypeptidase-like regulatory domain-containing protein, partial [Bacteroidota bacterium]|nr:carboxypeptidase-like regulatory domain-containing protein [Bacteroidota bacterium]
IFAEGIESASATIQLFSGDSLLSSLPITLAPGESSFTLTHVPQREGLQPFAVRISVLEEEASSENNRFSFTTRVLQRSQQILMVASAPHPDVATVRSILSRGEGRRVRTFIQKSPGSFYEGPVSVPADSCDLIILVGYPQLNIDAVSVLTDLIERGTPVLFHVSRNVSPDLFFRSFADYLPVLPRPSPMPLDGATFVPTARGLRHPILDLDQDDWGVLPPLMFGTGRWVSAPDAEVLGQARVRGVALSEPLLVVRNLEGRRSAMLLGSGTWRWLNLSDDPQINPPVWPRLLENLVQWLTAPEDNQRVRVTPASSTFDGSESILFTGQVYDESLRPVSDADVTLDLIAEDGRSFPYIMQSGPEGHYRLRLESLPEGLYEYRAQAVRLGEILGSDRGSFTVAPLGLEYRDLSADTGLLRQIALRSGGHYFTPETLGTLPAVLAQDSTFMPQISTETVERELWQWPAIAILILILLSIEWVLRKRSGLV